MWFWGSPASSEPLGGKRNAGFVTCAARKAEERNGAWGLGACSFQWWWAAGLTDLGYS